MWLIIQIALGLVLAAVALHALGWILSWPERRALKKLLAESEPAPAPPVYRPVVPGVEYDREGVAINAIASPKGNSVRSGFAWALLLLLSLALIGGLAAHIH